MTTETLYKSLKILSIIGIILAVYLFYSYLTRPQFQPCYVNAVINCDAVIKGEVATTFGIPTALYGLVGYIMILLATFFKKNKIILGFATFGLLFCLRITYIELIILKVICPVCIGCQLVMLGVFGFAAKLNLKKTSQS